MVSMNIQQNIYWAILNNQVNILLFIASEMSSPSRETSFCGKSRSPCLISHSNPYLCLSSPHLRMHGYHLCFSADLYCRGHRGRQIYLVLSFRNLNFKQATE